MSFSELDTILHEFVSHSPHIEGPRASDPMLAHERYFSSNLGSAPSSSRTCGQSPETGAQSCPESRLGALRLCRSAHPSGYYSPADSCAWVGASPHATFVSDLGKWAVVCALVASITEQVRLMPVQQAAVRDHIPRMSRLTSRGMHRARVDADARCWSRIKVPSFAISARMYSGVSRFFFVLGGFGRSDVDGIHGGANLGPQATLQQQFIDGGQRLISLLAFLQPMAKPKNDAGMVFQNFIGKTRKEGIETKKAINEPDLPLVLRGL